MGSVMVGETTDDDLMTALARVASNPAQVASLHEILGTYCHQCRNILNSLKLSLYLARRDSAPLAADVLRQLEPRYLLVERTFDRLQSICRPISLAKVRAPLEFLVEERGAAWIAVMAEHGRPLSLIAPAAPAISDFDPIRLREALDAFIEWRAEAGASGQPASLSWTSEEGRAQLTWDEPLSPPWASDDPPSARSNGLALALLTRVVSAHGGALDVDSRAGIQLSIQWPIDHPTP